MKILFLAGWFGVALTLRAVAALNPAGPVIEMGASVSTLDSVRQPHGLGNRNSAWATLAPILYAISPRDYAIQKMKDAGISNEFISMVEKLYVPEERDRIVALNVLGFLGKADYSGHYSARALRKTKDFMRRHRKKLKRAEAIYGVPMEVIASLIWVETKLGTQLGSHSVPHVYFSLLQADHPSVVHATLAELAVRAPTQVDEYRQKVVDRSVTKSNWALGELRSLDEISRSGTGTVEYLAGSYAGAFGIPQFIPSSYLRWGKPDLRRKVPDLFYVNDAISSVAYYLQANGWEPKNPESHRAALLHYNRAEGYVQVILKLASKLAGTSF